MREGASRTWSRIPEQVKGLEWPLYGTAMPTARREIFNDGNRNPTVRSNRKDGYVE